MPTLELSIEEGKLVAGLLNAERAQNKQEAAIKKTIQAAKEWGREEKQAADEAKRRIEDAMRMREREIAAQREHHDERMRMYRELFDKLDEQERRQRKANAAFMASQHAAQAQVAGFGLNYGQPLPPHLRSWMGGYDPMAAFGSMKSMGAPPVSASRRALEEQKRLALITSDMGAGANMAAGALSGVNAQLLGIIGSAASLAGAWNAIKAAQQHYQSVSAQDKDFNVSLAGTQANALLNLTGLPSDVKQRVLSQDIPGLQSRTGFPSQSALIQAVESGFIAGDDIGLALKATESAAKLTRMNPDQLPTYSGAAVDIMRASGETDADKALGFLLQVNSRVGDPRKQAENLPPGITAAALSAEGDDDREAARWGQAVFSSLSRVANDTEGDRTRTATQQFFTGSGGLREFFKGRKDDPGTVGGRIQLLQRDKKLREAFLEQFGGEGRFKVGYEKMLTPGDLAAQDLERSYGKVSFQSNTLREIIKEQGGTGALRMGGTAATAQANQEALMGSVEGRKRAIQEQARQIGETTMNSTARTWADYYVTGAEQRIGRHVRRGVGYDEIENSLHVLKGMAYGQGDWFGRDDYLRQAEARGDTAEADTYRAQLRYMEQQIQLLEDLKKQLADLNKSNEEMAQQKPSKPSPNYTGTGKK